MPKYPRKRTSTITLNADDDDETPLSKSVSPDLGRLFEEDEDEQGDLFMISTPKESPAKKSKKKSEIPKQHGRHLGAYLTETLGRHHEDEKNEQEAERYWAHVLKVRPAQSFDMEQTCVTLRNRIISAMSEPLPASYNHVILKLIEALEKATVELQKQTQGAARGPVEKMLEGRTLLEPVETEDDLYQAILERTRRNSKEISKIPQLTVQDLSVPSESPPRNVQPSCNDFETDFVHPAKQVMPKTEVQENAPKISRCFFDATVRVPSADSKSTNSSGRATVTAVGMRKSKQNAQTNGKPQRPIFAASQKPEPTGGKLSNPMAAMASKFAFASAKRTNNSAEGTARSPIKSALQVTEAFTKPSPLPNQRPLSGRYASPAGVRKVSPLSNPPLQMSDSTDSMRLTKRRSQSDAPDTRRFSFLPGDDADVATFKCPSPSLSESSLPSPATKRDHGLENGISRSGSGWDSQTSHEANDHTVRAVPKSP